MLVHLDALGVHYNAPLEHYNYNAPIYLGLKTIWTKALSRLHDLDQGYSTYEPSHLKLSYPFYTDIIQCQSYKIEVSQS